MSELPLDVAVRETSDGGKPIVVGQPGSPHAQVYKQIATRIWEKLSGGAEKRAPPIVVQ